jgi:hypothetical protein
MADTLAKGDRFEEGKENSHLANDSSKLSSSSHLGIDDLSSDLPYNPSSLVPLSPSLVYSRLFQDRNLTKPTEDERTIANKLASAEKAEQESDAPKSKQAAQIAEDATLPAKSHGNEPSRGAKIDQELREEEEAELKRKGKA